LKLFFYTPLFFSLLLSQTTPESVIKAYYKALYNSDINEAYGLLADKDKNYMNFNRFSEKHSIPQAHLIKSKGPKETFRVGKIEVSGAKAVAEVNIAELNMGGIVGTLFGSALLSDLDVDVKDKESVLNAVGDAFKDIDLPVLFDLHIVQMVKEGGRWKILLNQEMMEKIKELKTQAEALAEANDFGSAIDKYNSILILGGENASFATERENIEKELIGISEIHNYLSKVQITNIRVGKGVTGEKGVFGEIKNTGDRTLDEVEITIYCLDKEGIPVFDEDYHPVLVTEFSFGNDNKPLKPNYSKKFGYKMDDAPSEWAGDVSVVVSNVEFSAIQPREVKPMTPSNVKKNIEDEKTEERRVRFIPYDDPPVPVGGYGAIQRNIVYPEIAQEGGIEGTVVIQAFVSKEGIVTETVVLKGIPNSGLDEAAMDAIRKTKFKPAKQRKRAVGVWTSIPVNFRLR